MDLSTIYSKTPKGLRARASLIGGLSSHLMKVLTHVDGTSRAENILLKFDHLAPEQLTADLTKLEQEGYIRLATVTSAVDDSWALTINFEPMVVEEFQSEEALEISAETKKLQQQAQQLQAEKLAAEMQAQQAEAERLAAQQKADKKAQKLRDKEKIKAQVKVKAHLEEESRELQRQQQEAAKAAEMARKKAEEEAAQIKAEAEAQLKAKQQALKIAEQQAAERAAKLAEETQRKAELKAREAAEHAEAAAEATAKENARIQIQRISREAEEAQRKADSEIKAKQETERLEALRLAKAVEEARQAEIKAQAQREATEAAEQEKIIAEAAALAAAEKAKLELEKIEQEKLEQANLEKQKQAQEALNQEKARLEIASVLRKAEDDRKNAVAQAKAEKLEAKRIAKAEQEAQQQAERKAKDNAKQQAKDQKLKAQAEEKAKLEAAEAAKRDLVRIAEEAQIARFEAEQKATQEIDDLTNQADVVQSKVENMLKNTALEHSQTVQVAHAKLTAEEQTNNASKENAKLEMARIAEEANQARQQFIAQEYIAETKRNSPNNNLPILDDFAAAEAAEEAAFEVEEQVAEAEEKIRHTIERTAKKSAEDASRTDIKNAAIAEAEAMASVQGKSKSFISTKIIKQWLASASKITFIYVPVLTLVLLVLLHFINLSILIKPIEQLATESVGEPVEIKKVHASLWPQPHLVLEAIAIGSINIKAVHVLPQATSLFEDIKVVKSLVIEGLNIEQANFGQPLSWVSNISQAKNLKVEQINLENLTLAIRDLELESFDGKVTLNATGELNSIDLVSSNNALSVMILPQAGDYEVALKAANWALPFNQKIMFNSLNAKAIASNNQITFSQIEGDIYGGNLTAKAQLNWPDNANLWVSSGDFKLANANAEQLLNTFGSAVVINGKLSLDGNFSIKAREASKLTDATNMNASFDVRQGNVQGIELARAVMSRGSQSLAGDSTSFDKLTGRLKFNQGQYQFAKLVLTSPQFNANGFINLNASQAITGRINADLAAQSRRLRANFGIVGRGRDLKSQ